MSKLRDVITGKQRKADRAQAQRIAAARADLTHADRNRYRSPDAGPDSVVHDDTRLIPGPQRPDRRVEANLRITRAQAVLERAERNGTPRARSWGAALDERGSVNAPARRRQPQMTRGRTR